MKYYYNFHINTRMYHYSNDSHILFQVNEKLFFIYKAEPSLYLPEYLADIGGLMSIYFGISMIDLSNLIGNSAKYLKLILHRIYTMKQTSWLIVKIVRHVDLLKSVVHFLEIIKWRIITSFLTISIMICQIYILTDEYFHYSTQTRYTVTGITNFNDWKLVTKKTLRDS